MAFSNAGRYGPENVVAFATGLPIAGATATVYLVGTTTKATLYTDRTKATTAANPTTADSYGNLSFFADPGPYDLLINGRTLPITVPVDPGEVDAESSSGAAVEVPSSTEAALGTATAGLLKRVTDGVRGLWMGTGTKWFSTAGNVVNVKEFGATGDGVTNDRANIQSAIDAAPDGSSILLPPGTYLIDGGGASNNLGLLVTSRNRLTFIGPGATLKAGSSLLTQRCISAGVTAADVVAPCTDIRVGGLGFDRNGRTSFANCLSIYNSTRVWVQNNRFYDSAHASGANDQYGCVINDSTDVWFTDNVISQQQIEFDRNVRCKIKSNFFDRAEGSIAIAAVTVGNANQTLTDYDISHNFILDCEGDGITVGTDASSSAGTMTLRNIRITDNVIYHSGAGPYANQGGQHGILLTATLGPTMVWGNIHIERNVIYYSSGTTPSGRAISMAAQSAALQTFHNCSFRDNHVYGFTHATLQAMALQFLNRVEISGNRVLALRGGTPPVKGIFIGSSANGNIHNNFLEASDTTYFFTASDGNNRWWNNQILGAPTTGLSISAAATDEFDRGVQPTLASAATITLPRLGNVFTIDGTTNITNITARAEDIGRTVTLRFGGALTVNDGTGNLNLAGNFVTTGEDTLTLACHSFTSPAWWEVARSVN